MLTTMNQADLVETNPTVSAGETAGILFYRPQTGTELASVVRAEHLNDLLSNIQAAQLRLVLIYLRDHTLIQMF